MISAPQDRGALLAIALLLSIPGCDCTGPRGKPWRHEPDPTDLAAAEPRSPALIRDQEATEILADRDHTLRIHMDAEPRGLNPLIAPSVWTRRITMGSVFETLIRYEPPEGGAGSGPGRYAPGLAHSWKIMPGGKEIRFYLEQGVTFHDGRTMSSVDVQFTLDAIRDPRKRIDHLRPMLAEVAAVELITAREVRLVLYRPDGWVLRALAEIPILPMSVYEGGFAAGGRIVGTGPWQLKSWKDGKVRLTRHGRYWGKPPAIPDVEFVYEPDAARALTEAKRGAYDVIPGLIPEHWPDQALAPGIKAAFASLELRPPRLRYLAFNCKVPALADPRVRHAIALLVDRDKLIKDGDDGLARPIGGPVWPGGPGDGPAPPTPPYDVVEAARLLDDAGWIDSDKDGVRDRDGQRLEIVALLLDRPGDRPGRARDTPERRAVIAPMQGVGVAVDVRPVKADENSYLMKRVRDGDFGIALLEATQPVDTDLRPLLASDGKLNFGGCGSRRIDQALAALVGVWEPAARVPLIGELAAALAEAWPIAGISAPAPQGLVHRRVQGVLVWDGWIDLRRLSFDPRR
jgi:peptide/nickel transport system substrate-binding protein